MKMQSIQEYVGERLAEERAALGDTQEAFAERLGVSQPQYSRIEKGRRAVGAAELYVLAEALELPVQELFPPQKQERLLDDERRLVEAWRRRDLKVLLALISDRFAK